MNARADSHARDGRRYGLAACSTRYRLDVRPDEAPGGIEGGGAPRGKPEPLIAIDGNPQALTHRVARINFSRREEQCENYQMKPKLYESLAEWWPVMSASEALLGF